MNSQESMFNTCSKNLMNLFKQKIQQQTNKGIREFIVGIQDEKILCVNLALRFSIRIVKQDWIDLYKMNKNCGSTTS